ncbi:MAG: hypothetical protein IT503_19555 [Burkholderiaceae bacterium]|nr:hypothetical protein [Burkholderiaceae bacterium]
MLASSSSAVSIAFRGARRARFICSESSWPAAGLAWQGEAAHWSPASSATTPAIAAMASNRGAKVATTRSVVREDGCMAIIAVSWAGREDVGPVLPAAATHDQAGGRP